MHGRLRMPKVEQVQTILNFKSNNDNVRDAMCSYIEKIYVLSIIWHSDIVESMSNAICCMCQIN